VSQYSHLTADPANPDSPATKIARLVGRDRRVLDVGCAHGYLAEVLTAQGCRVIGIERDPEDAARARAHCDLVIEHDVEDPGWVAHLPERDFDAVVLSDVLEHLRDPAALLRRIGGVLAPGGMIVASVPNVAHVSVRLELLLGSFRYESLGILDATHLRFYTRETLEALFAECGFAVMTWDHTFNDIADSVVIEYLRRAGLAYTQEFRQFLTRSEAAPYQFIVTAVPDPTIRPALADAPKPIADTARIDTRHPRSTPRRPETRSPTADTARIDTRLTDLERPRTGGLNVLQVIHQFLPRHVAGTEIYCANLSAALVRRGHAVRVLSGAQHPDDVGTGTHWDGDAGFVVERVAATRAFRWFGSGRHFLDRFNNPRARAVIPRLLDRVRPDVVHIQHLLYLSAELIRECRRRGIPVVVTLADYWFLCHRVRLERRDGTLCSGPARGIKCPACLNAPALLRTPFNPGALAATVYRQAYLMARLREVDRILSPSAFVRDVHVRNGVPPKLIGVCDYGTVPPPAEFAARAARRTLHVPLRFGYLGSLMPHKGVHVLVDAFNRLPPASAELHVFGAAPDPKYSAALQERTRHPRIRWWGPLPVANRWRALADIDVLVVPSIWYENSPLTIHEALMMRVPVIGAAMGGIPELVRDGVTGRIYLATDTDALCARLREVIDDPDVVRRWRANIVPPKTMEAHVDEIEALYRELVATRAARSV
jgi:glycosyltransferase involved in cell wall biosynthesis/SAM-dependent methyltransferase